MGVVGELRFGTVNGGRFNVVLVVPGTFVVGVCTLARILGAGEVEADAAVDAAVEGAAETEGVPVFNAVK